MAAPLVPNGLWEVLEPLLPPEPPKPRGGRPRLPDRTVLGGILFILRSGIPWQMLPGELGCGSGMTCWRRLRDWQIAGIWERLHHELLNRLHDAGRIDWSPASLDSASIPVKHGGDNAGPNPTDRGKLGTKSHVIVDRTGIPLAVRITAANVHDSRVFESIISAIPPVKRKARRAPPQQTFEGARRQGIRCRPVS